MRNYVSETCYVSESIIITLFLVLNTVSVITYGFNIINVNPMLLIIPIYSFTITIIVQFIFSQLNSEERMHVTGTWSSMMSAEGVYGSKFLLFSMTIICYGMISPICEILNKLSYSFGYWLFFTQLVAQPLLLLIGFFPSNLNSRDSFIYEEEYTKPNSCKHAFSLTMHYIGSLVYGLAMTVTNILLQTIIKNKIVFVLIIIKLTVLFLFLFMQIVLVWKSNLFRNDLLNRFSISVEIIFLALCSTICALHIYTFC